MGVPADLRTVLEQCLSEEASTDNLEIYLPTVRQIITSLLQGLRGKQSIYRRMVSDHRHKSSSERGTPATSTHDRTESRSSRSSRRERAGESTTSLHRSQLSRTIDNDKDVVYARRSTSRRDPGLSTSTSTTNSDDPLPPPHPPPTGGLPPPPVQQSPATPDRNGIHHECASDTPRQRPTPAPLESTTRSDYFGAVDDHSVAKGSPPPPPLHLPPPVPAGVKRYSLVDKPAPSPVVVVDEPTSPATDPTDLLPDVPTTLEVMQTPGVANSLAALKKSDTLERPASKRFSTYNISKMTGGSARDRLARGASSNRRSLIYIRDPSSGVQYELEDMDEVKEKCLLSLNIERAYHLFSCVFASLTIRNCSTRSIKKHIDAQIPTLSQDIKDLRTTFAANRYSAHFGGNVSQLPLAESTLARPRPSDRQLQHVARRISQLSAKDRQAAHCYP